MTYDFALDKKAVISLIAGSVVIAALLFVAGLIVGRQWLGTDSVAVAHAAENERAALPTEPVLNEEAAAPAAPKAKPALPLPKQAGETPAMPTAPAAPVAVPGNVPAPQVVSEAAIENADPSAASAQPVESDYVTVQVGVFLDDKEAGRLLQQMESKGYGPTFFSGRDAESRQWYAVRIGVYSDKQQAANAAANFTKQEKLKAVVRPVESL
ncbi:MAG TPA: SPOR domain-containing protein [Pyrinomonadaceae bacterium]|nr:SPOR domain-containing protein [Pyrinomonadaceae bacterium]